MGCYSHLKKDITHKYDVGKNDVHQLWASYEDRQLLSISDLVKQLQVELEKLNVYEKTCTGEICQRHLLSLRLDCFFNLNCFESKIPTIVLQGNIFI